jgi:RhtB (resistance to homoserine/threonine) family protein
VSVTTALLAYLAAAALFTITPGLDTAMVLRTAAAEGPRRGALAGLGIICGCLVWGVAVALGLGVLLAASQAAYTVLKWAGAAYLAWLGLGLIFRPRSKIDLVASPGAPRRGNWWLRGFTGNLLNPKIGVFYVSFLPQFVPANTPAAPFIVLLAVIHGLLTVVWFAALIAATAPAKRWLQRQAVVRWLDRTTGAVFLLFGLRLALDRR